MVPTPFCAMQYFSDQLNVLGDENSMKIKMLRLREAIVNFRAAAVKYRESYRKHIVLPVVTVKNITVGE